MPVTNPNISLFRGDNLYLLERTMQNLREAFEKKHGDLNITILESEDELTASNIKSALSAAPFLGEKRLVIIKNFLKLGDSEDQDKIEAFLEKLPESTLAIFYENPNIETKKRPKSTLKKTVEKMGNVKEFTIPTPQELVTWIQNRLQKYNTTISQKLALQLADDCGLEMLTLSNEVAKLGLYAENREVTTADLTLLTPKNYAATIFQFTDSLNAKDAKTAIEKLHTLVEMGEEMLIVLTMIARHFRMLILVKDLLETQKIPKHIIFQKMSSYDPNMKPYPVKIAVDQSSKFTLDHMKQIYNSLVQINVDLRTGKIPQGPGDKHLLLLELEKFIMQIAHGQDTHHTA